MFSMSPSGYHFDFIVVVGWMDMPVQEWEEDLTGVGWGPEGPPGNMEQSSNGWGSTPKVGIECMLCEPFSQA